MVAQTPHRSEAALVAGLANGLVGHHDLAYGNLDTSALFFPEMDPPDGMCCLLV